MKKAEKCSLLENHFSRKHSLHLLYHTTGTIPQGAKYNDYPMAINTKRHATETRIKNTITKS